MTVLSESQRQQERIRREHRGCGEGGEYVPGRRLSETPKIGRVTRYPCHRSGARVMIFRSDGALATFLEEHWNLDAVEFRESFPLDLQRTQDIATGLGIEHPKFLDGSARVLYTDLLVDYDRQGRRSVKALSTTSRPNQGDGPLTPGRTIERAYWSALGVEFELRYQDGMNASRSKNLDWLYMEGERLHRWPLSPAQEGIQRIVLRELSGRFNRTVADACRSATRVGRLRGGESILALRQLLVLHHVLVDLDTPSILDLSLSEVEIGRRSLAA